MVGSRASVFYAFIMQIFFLSKSSCKKWNKRERQKRLSFFSVSLGIFFHQRLRLWVLLVYFGFDLTKMNSSEEKKKLVFVIGCQQQPNYTFFFRTFGWEKRIHFWNENESLFTHIIYYKNLIYHRDVREPIVLCFSTPLKV